MPETLEPIAEQFVVFTSFLNGHYSVGQASSFEQAKAWARVSANAPEVLGAGGASFVLNEQRLRSVLLQQSLEQAEVERIVSEKFHGQPLAIA